MSGWSRSLMKIIVSWVGGYDNGFSCVRFRRGVEGGEDEDDRQLFWKVKIYIVLS